MDSRRLYSRGLGAATVAPPTDAQLRALAATQPGSANAAYASGVPLATLIAQGNAPNMTALTNAWYAANASGTAPIPTPAMSSSPSPVITNTALLGPVVGALQPGQNVASGGNAIIGTPTPATAPMIAGTALPVLIAAPVVIAPSVPSTPIPVTQTNTQGAPVYVPPSVVTPTIPNGTTSYSGAVVDTGGGGYVLASDLYGTSATADGMTTTPATGGAADAVAASTAPADGLLSGVIAVPYIGNVPKPIAYGTAAFLIWLLLRGKGARHGY